MTIKHSTIPNHCNYCKTFTTIACFLLNSYQYNRNIIILYTANCSNCIFFLNVGVLVLYVCICEREFIIVKTEKFIISSKPRVIR